MVATETALDILHRGGFDPAHAAAIARSALFTGLTLAMSEPGFEPGMAEAERIEHMRRSRVRLALLPPERFPRLAEAAEPLTDCSNPDFHYQVGVDMFIAGVQALAKR